MHRNDLPFGSKEVVFWYQRFRTGRDCSESEYQINNTTQTLTCISNLLPNALSTGHANDWSQGCLLVKRIAEFVCLNP